MTDNAARKVRRTVLPAGGWRLLYPRPADRAVGHNSSRAILLYSDGPVVISFEDEQTAVVFARRTGQDAESDISDFPVARAVTASYRDDSRQPGIGALRAEHRTAACKAVE